MAQLTSRLLVLIFAATIVFHGLVVAGVIPHTIVWGGRLTDSSQVLIFEAVSITLNLLFLGVCLVRAGWLKIQVSELMQSILLKGMALVFMLNTAGNLASENSFEKSVFTPVTALIAILCLIAARRNFRSA